MQFLNLNVNNGMYGSNTKYSITALQYESIPQKFVIPLTLRI